MRGAANSKRGEYEGWQYIGRAMAIFLYVLGFLFIFHPDWIAAKYLFPVWFYAGLSFIVGPIAIAGGYYWEDIDVSRNYLLWTKGVGRLYKKTVKISYDDIITVYGIDKETKGIYMIVKSRPQWVSFLKKSVLDMDAFKEFIGNKSGNKEELIRAARTKPRCRKSDIEGIRRLP